MTEEIFKILICGSVDDGKSTLMGRLLHDTKSVFVDQLKDVKNTSIKYGSQGNDIDYALLSDGLQSEIEQGITIDVGYKYFTLKNKKFIFADTPGHFEYTRNMATGASNSDYAILLVDAHKGISQHTKLCILVCSIFKIKKIIIVINKIDLIDYKQTVYNKIKSTLLKFVKNLDSTDLDFVPISALKGDNVLKKSVKTRWFKGKSLFKILNELTFEEESLVKKLNIGIQLISKSHSNRLYCGELFSGTVHKNQKVLISPSGQINYIKKIYSSKGEVKKSNLKNFITLSLKNDTDLSRGSHISTTEDPIKLYNIFYASLVWIDKRPLILNQRYNIRFILNNTEGKITYISYKYSSKDYNRIKSDKIQLNEIGFCKFELRDKLPIQLYSANKKLGSFIIVDQENNRTVAAGVIENLQDVKNKDIFWQDYNKNSKLLGNSDLQKPVVLWFTGLSASGKSTVAELVNKKLTSLGKKSYVLDGDNLRHGLCKDLGFSEIERKENIRRAAEVSRLLLDTGLIVLSCFISPFQKDREIAKNIIGKNNFYEIFCKASLKACEKRDKKNLYKKARLNIIKNFTGITAKYETPMNPDLIINSEKEKAENLASFVINFLKKKEII